MWRKHWCILSGSRTGCNIDCAWRASCGNQRTWYMCGVTNQTFTVTDIKAVDEAGYAEIPDVLFVCVKGYSIPDIIPF